MGRASGLRVIAGVAVFALAAPVAASPLRLFGFGGKSPATVGTGAASVDDYESTFLNPAGLAHTRKRLTIGGLVGTFSLELDDDKVDTDLANGTVFGLAVPLAFGGALKDRVGFALGLYIPNNTLNKVSSPFPGEPSFTLLENTAHVIAVQIATGVKINDRWSVGAGTRILAALRGLIDVRGDPAGRFITRSEQQMILHFAPVVGARFVQSDTVAWGVNITGESRSRYDVTVKSDLGDAIPVQLPQLLMAGTPQYDPLAVVVEAGWRAKPSLRLTGHLAYERWSQLPLPTIDPVVGHEAVQEPPDYRDTVVPKVAVEWGKRTGDTQWDLRGGYAFHFTPAPEATGQQSLLDNHRHVLAYGMGVSWPGTKLPIRVDAWVQVHVLQPRSHTKDAAAFDAEHPPPFDTIDTKGWILAGGLATGVDL